MIKLIGKLIGIYLSVLNVFSPRLAGKHAFFVFCYPFKVKLKPKQQAFYNTAEWLSFEFEGKKLAMYKWGSGSKSILCVHGWSSNTYRWKKYIETLDKNEYTVYAFDAPGHGNSEGTILNVPIYARALETVIGKIGKLDCVLAHSIGAFTSMYLFHNKPELSPAKMVVMSSPGSAEEFVNFFEKLLKPSKKLMVSMETYFEEYVGLSVAHFNINSFAVDQQAKALIIHDELDKETPFTNAIDLHKVWKNSELTVTKGFGHKMRDISVVESVVGFFGADLKQEVLV